MSLFRRDRRPSDPPPSTGAILDHGIDFEAAHREAFEATDAIAGPILERLRRSGIGLESATPDQHFGSAVLVFRDGTRLRVATKRDEETRQLAAAASLIDTRLTFSRLRDDAPGRILVFTSAQWTIYLVIESAVAL